MQSLVDIVPASLWAAKGELRYSLLLPAPTPSNNAIKGMHFHVYRKERETWMRQVQIALAGAPRFEPIQRSFVMVSRECAGELDWDNVYGGLKPLLDCLVSPSSRNPSGLGLIQDDNPKNMPFPPFVRQLKGKRGAGCTTVEIYQLTD